MEPACINSHTARRASWATNDLPLSPSVNLLHYFPSAIFLRLEDFFDCTMTCCNTLGWFVTTVFGRVILIFVKLCPHSQRSYGHAFSQIWQMVLVLIGIVRQVLQRRDSAWTACPNRRMVSSFNVSAGQVRLRFQVCVPVW